MKTILLGTRIRLVRIKKEDHFVTKHEFKVIQVGADYKGIVKVNDRVYLDRPELLNIPVNEDPFTVYESNILDVIQDEE